MTARRSFYRLLENVLNDTMMLTEGPVQDQLQEEVAILKVYLILLLYSYKAQCKINSKKKVAILKV